MPIKHRKGKIHSLPDMPTAAFSPALDMEEYTAAILYTYVNGFTFVITHTDGPDEGGAPFVLEQNVPTVAGYYAYRIDPCPKRLIVENNLGGAMSEIYVEGVRRIK